MEMRAAEMFACKSHLAITT